MTKSTDHLTKEMVQQISRLLREPKWLTDSRVKALSCYETLPTEPISAYAKYADLSGIEFDKMNPLSTLEFAPKIPPELIPVLQNLQNNPTIVHLDSTLVLAAIPDELRKKGVVFTDFATALKSHSDLMEEILKDRVIPPSDDKFAALSAALLTNGVILYVPRNLAVSIPFRCIQLTEKAESTTFLNTVVKADKASKVTFLEESYSLMQRDSDAQSFLGIMSEVLVSEGAEVNYSSIQNLAEHANVFINRRAKVAKDGKISWNIASLGGRFYRSRLASHLVERGASAEATEVSFGNGQQRFDQVSDLIHTAPDTQGTILTAGVLKDRSRALFRGIIKITKEAKNANGYLAERAMLLGQECKADAIPVLEIETNEVRATHSASMAQVDQEQVFYMMSRGLKEDEAKKMIVLGFFEPAVSRIPLIEVQEDVRYLLESKWLGKKPLNILQQKRFTAVSEEELRKRSQDFFETHYKYRQQ